MISTVRLFGARVRTLQTSFIDARRMMKFMPGTVYGTFKCFLIFSESNVTYIRVWGVTSIPLNGCDLLNCCKSSILRTNTPMVCPKTCLYLLFNRPLKRVGAL